MLNEILTLKKNNARMYSRIADIEMLLNDEDCIRAFYYKSANIIDTIIARDSVSDAEFVLFKFNCVEEPDESDKLPDYIYGSKFTYTQRIDKNFILKAEYIWQSPPEYDIHMNMQTLPEVLNIKIIPVSLPEILYGKVNNIPALNNRIIGGFKNKPCDLRAFTSKRMIRNLKKELLQKRFKHA